LNQQQYQPVAVVNYPNDNEFTRVTEFKHLTGQEHQKTSIVYEFSRAEGDPYYPIPRQENAAIYKKYQQLAEESGIMFVGRLATYKYYNMDQVVAQALTAYAKLSNLSRAEATVREVAPQLATVTFPMNLKPKRSRALSARRRTLVSE